MSSIAALISGMKAYDGYLVQSYLLENIDLIGYVASFYLVMVGKGSTVLSWVYTDKRHARTEAALASQLTLLSLVGFLFHATFAALSLGAGLLLLSAHLRPAVGEKGFYTAACAWNDSLVYMGPAGVLLTFVTLSKMAELFTSVLFALRDFLLSRNPNAAANTAGLAAIVKRTHNSLSAAHWWYYVSIPLYFWHTYSVGSSLFPFVACVNAILRGVANAAMAVEDLSLCGTLSATATAMRSNRKNSNSSRSLAVKIAAVVPTLTTAIECLACGGITAYGGYMGYTNPNGCAMMQANVRMCVLMYLGAFVFVISSVTSSSSNSDKDAKKSSNGNGKKNQ